MIGGQKKMIGMICYKIKEKIKERIKESLNRTEDERIFNAVMRYIKFHKIEGDYLEFGLYKGDSFIQAWKEAKKCNIENMRFIGFDSFQGFPELKGVDKKYSLIKDGSYKYSMSSFKAELAKHYIFPFLDDKIILKEGWFKDTLNEKTKRDLKISKVAVAMLDCDLYESTIEVLNFLKNNIQDGGIIMFDDWFLYKAKKDLGQQKAVKEWLKMNKDVRLVEYRKFRWGGISFIVDKKVENES